MKQIVHIEKLVYGGNGLARTDQGIVFVSDVLPDEKVCVDIDDTSARQKFASPIAIEEQSPHRRTPPCPLFGICGGCDWLFCDYQTQLSIKKEIFIECIKRIGKIAQPPDCEMFPSAEFGYRRRVQFKTDLVHHALGFYKRKSHEVVAMKHCPLLVPALNSLLAHTDEIIPRLSPDLGQIMCIAGTKNQLASWPVLGDYTRADTEICVGNKTFKVSGNGFFQSNAFLCETLGTWGQGIVHGNYCVDLYGGVGFFTIMFHDCFSKGIIVDTIESQINMARTNIKINNISHVSARATSAENFLSENLKNGPHIDCLIVDPPRTGLTNHVCLNIVRCLPSMIYYISCNPSTQARDVGFLIRTAGYSIEKTALFDLYPNTHHMETIIVLTR
jgi:23S rRNA (uracil1939-C5)-methyltransferase